MECYRMSGDWDYMLRVVVGILRRMTGFTKADYQHRGVVEHYLQFCHGADEVHHGFPGEPWLMAAGHIAGKAHGIASGLTGGCQG